MLYRVPRLRRVASLVFYKGENAYFLTFFSRKCANVIIMQYSLIEIGNTHFSNLPC